VSANAGVGWRAEEDRARARFLAFVGNARSIRVEVHGVVDTMEMQRDEIDALRAQIAERDRHIAQSDARIALLERELGRISELERQIALLVERLQGAADDKQRLEARLKDLLAKRRAIDETQQGQLQLAFHGEPDLPAPPCANEAPDGETPGDELRPRVQRKHAPRKLAYEALPREHVHHEIEAHERVCKLTGKTLVVVGEKTTEELEYHRAKLVVVVHHRAVYGLGAEDQRERRVEPVVAPGPVQPIEGATVGPGLLAHILVQKYCDHLPLYRQQAIFERAGLQLPRQTLCDWVMAAAFNLAPIHGALKARILASGVVQLDDTPVDCQGLPGKPNFEARLWTHLSPLVPGVVFDFTLDRGHDHVLDFLGEGIQGYLVGDGYAGYFTIAKKRPGLVVTGCWAHALRKARDAIKESPAEATSLVSMIGTLFGIEAEAADRGLEPGAVRDLRAERSKPALDRIRARIDELLAAPRSEQSLLAIALRYIDNQWPALTAFLGDGRVPIHNNSCERAIRPIAIGRNNWLFAGSERGGEAAAIVYSLVESCRREGVDPWLYLRDVLIRVATHPASRIGELMPDRWKQTFGGQHAA